MLNFGASKPRVKGGPGPPGPPGSAPVQFKFIIAISDFILPTHLVAFVICEKTSMSRNCMIKR